MATLAKLKPSFVEDGTTTAGNSSQLSDGASAVLVASRAFAERNNLPILGVCISYAEVGVDPAIMGVGPAYAIPKALEKAGMTVDEIDLFEINEAFAGQCLFCQRHLNIPMEKLNVSGGGISLGLSCSLFLSLSYFLFISPGHPLGCTGSRLIATLLHALKRTNKRYGLVSMCIGTGMGMCAIFENIHYQG